MKMRTALKRAAQARIGPLLNLDRLHQRTIVFHEVLEEHEMLLPALIAALDHEPSLEYTLTFDDGFHSSYTAIRQLVGRRAIFFVCPMFIDVAEDVTAREQFFRSNLRRRESLHHESFRNAVRPASWEDLHELVRLGHTIGAHTLSHARLSSIASLRELEREIIGAGDAIEDRLQVPIDTFAYPFGDWRSIDARALRIIGKRYRVCYTGARGNNAAVCEGSMMRWRDPLQLTWPMDTVRFTLHGGFDWWYSFARARLLRMEHRVAMAT